MSRKMEPFYTFVTKALVLAAIGLLVAWVIIDTCDRQWGAPGARVLDRKERTYATDKGKDLGLTFQSGLVGRFRDIYIQPCDSSTKDCWYGDILITNSNGRVRYRWNYELNKLEEVN